MTRVAYLCIPFTSWIVAILLPLYVYWVSRAMAAHGNTSPLHGIWSLLFTDPLFQNSAARSGVSRLKFRDVSFKI